MQLTNASQKTNNIFMDVFDKIINGEIPSRKLYEDDICVIILDINPIKKGHCLVIPKTCVDTLDKLNDEICSKLLLRVKMVDRKMREKLLCDAVSIFINDGKAAGQEVPHLHIHILPRFKTDDFLNTRNIQNTKEKYEEGEADKYYNLLKFE